MEKIKNRLTKKHWRIIGGVCAAIVVCAIIGLTTWDNGDTEVYDELRREAAPAATFTPTATNEPQPTPISAAVHTPEPVDNGVRPTDRDIQFETLLQRNPDIIAWVWVEGTEIDYPVLKSKDNMDYLEHDIDGEENVAGAVFMDMGNRLNFADRNTVIYGHNMKNGTMFAGLHQFEDREFFDQNRAIKLYTPDGMRTYDIIAAYMTDDRNILYQTDYSNDAVWEAYIESVYGNRDMGANLLEMPIGNGDQIITLSTCERGEDEQRYFVQGVLRKDAL